MHFSVTKGNYGGYIVQLHHNDIQPNNSQQVIYRMNESKMDILNTFFPNGFSFGTDQLESDKFVFKPEQPLPSDQEEEILRGIEGKFNELLKKPRPSL